MGMGVGVVGYRSACLRHKSIPAHWGLHTIVSLVETDALSVTIFYSTSVALGMENFDNLCHIQP